jgi:hypothetical protein
VLLEPCYTETDLLGGLPDRSSIETQHRHIVIGREETEKMKCTELDTAIRRIWKGLAEKEESWPLAGVTAHTDCPSHRKASST